MTLAQLDAAYAAHLLTQPRAPEHHDACDCVRCDEWRSDMAAWGAREAELADACTAAEAAESAATEQAA